MGAVQRERVRKKNYKKQRQGRREAKETKKDLLTRSSALPFIVFHSRLNPSTSLSGCSGPCDSSLPSDSPSLARCVCAWSCAQSHGALSGCRAPSCHTLTEPHPLLSRRAGGLNTLEEALGETFVMSQRALVP